MTQSPNGMMPSGTSQTPTQEAVFGLLRDQLMRRFKIDIENDSTIAGDESKEREDRQGFIIAVTNFMEAWGPMVIQKPELAGLAGQLLLFGVRAFRVGRELEETIEETAEKLQAAGQGPPQPDPKAATEAAKLQATQVKAQAEVQKAQTEAQSKLQSALLAIEQAKSTTELKVAEMRMKLAIAEQEHHHKMIQGELEHNAAMDKMKVNTSQAVNKQATAKPPLWPTKQPGF